MAPDPACADNPCNGPSVQHIEGAMQDVAKCRSLLACGRSLILAEIEVQLNLAALW